jgi:myo-inositol-1(or 4)-monophosphatase
MADGRVRAPKEGAVLRTLVVFSALCGPDNLGAVNPFLLTALRAADAAAAVHARWARRIGVEAATLKGRGDFVSQADVEAQEAALGVIRSEHPDHAVLAEEGAAARAPERRDGPLWVVDPLDGTANFLHGHPMYAASVALAVQGRPVAGAVSCSSTGERWWAARGEGAWKNGCRLRVSGTPGLEGSLVGTGFPFKVQHLIPDYVDQLARVLRAGAGVRRGGSAALDLCYLAEGRLDGFWELFLSPWDFAAGIVIVQEAGGLVTGLDLAPPPLEAGGVLAANARGFLEELAQVLGVRPGDGGGGGAAASPPVSGSAGAR